MHEPWLDVGRPDDYARAIELDKTSSDTAKT
jgi:NDP-sugar pyrophosphorylase family protein